MTYVLIGGACLIIGALSGFMLAIIGETMLEKDYVRKGVAKLNGEFYYIRPVPKD